MPNTTPPRSSGECWIATGETRPELTDGQFGAGWEHLGRIADGQDEVRKALQRTFDGRDAGTRAIDFYIFADPDSLTAREFTKRRDDPQRNVPEKFWLGIEWLTGGRHLVVTVRPASPRVLARRPPEHHPGRTDRLGPAFGVRVSADEHRVAFERVV